MTEAELINGCIANDRRCQNQLYKLYFPFMSKIAFRYYENKNDAVASINLAWARYLVVFIIHNVKILLPAFINTS